MKLNLVLCCLLLAAMVPPAFGQSADPLSTIETDTVQGTLENGIRYFLLSVPSDSNKIVMRLVVQAGSLQETPAEAGLAHLVEHLAFEGTEHFKAQEVVQFLESQGMRFGADLNASTDYGSTQYRLSLPADQPEALNRGLAILADWSHGPLASPDMVEKEKNIIVEEDRVRTKSLQGRITDFVTQAVYQDTPFAGHAPIGTMDKVRSFTAADVHRFVTQWYSPRAISVIIVGSFNPDDMEAQVKSAFAQPFRNASAQNPPPLPVMKPTVASVVNTFRDPELPGNMIFGLRTTAPDIKNTEAWLRWTMLGNVAANALNQRLQAATKDPNAGLVAAAYQWNWMPQFRAQLGYRVNVREGQAEKGFQSYLNVLKSFISGGLSQEEFEQWRQAYQQANEASLPENVDLETRAAGLADWIVLGLPMGVTDEFYAYRKGLVADVKREDVNAFIAQNLGPQAVQWLVLGTEKASNVLPTSDTILKIQSSTFSQAAAAPVARPATLVPSPPTPGRVESMQAVAGTRIVLWTLSNGIKIYQYADELGPREFMLRAFAPGGLSTVADSQRLNATMSLYLTGNNGSGPLDAAQVQSFLGGKVVSLKLSLDEDQAVVTGNCDPSDPVALERFFQLLYSTLTAPRRDAPAEKTTFEDLQRWLTNADQQPQTLYANAIRSVLTNDDPRLAPVTATRLASVDPEAAAKFRASFFQNLGDFTFVMTGGSQVTTLKTLIEQWLASIPTSKPSGLKARDTGVRPMRGPVTKIVRSGTDQKAVTTFLLEVPYPYSANAWHLSTVLKEALAIRLRERLRQEDEGTYGVDVGIDLGPTPYPFVRLKVDFTCAPERQESLAAAVREELAAIAAGKLSDDVVKKALEIRVRDVEAGEKTYAYWMDSTFWSLAHHDDLTAQSRWRDFYRSVKKDDVLKMAQRLLLPAQGLTVVLLPASP